MSQTNDIETAAPDRVGDTLGYARVSTHDQNPDAQRDRLGRSLRELLETEALWSLSVILRTNLAMTPSFH